MRLSKTNAAKAHDAFYLHILTYVPMHVKQCEEKFECILYKVLLTL